MRKFRWDSVFCALVLCLGIGGVCYVVSRADTSSIYANAPAVEETVLILDSGHGGMDGGCSAADGTPEKGINLNIMLSLRDMANIFGIKTIVTRDTDTSIHDKGVTGIRAQKISDMENRLEIFNSVKGAVCISIHQNTYTDPKFKGAQMFYSSRNEESADLAQIMQNLFKENLQPYNTRETKLCGSELYLCHYCENPAVMAECGFLSNEEEAKNLESSEYQQKIAFTIFESVYMFKNGK